MRKIEANLNRSISAYREFKESNTSTKIIENVIYIYLFGNEIAKVENDVLKVNYKVCSSYTTNTTSSRIRGLGVNYRVKKGEPKIYSHHSFYNLSEEKEIELLEEDLLNKCHKNQHKSKLFKY